MKDQIVAVIGKVESRGAIMPIQHDGRVEWIDAAKGIGIILVVIGHTLRGLETANIVSFGGIFGEIDKAIYSFHMPLMFLLSGLFIHKVLPRSWLGYILRHAKRLIWPLILWTYIFFLCKIIAGGSANNPVGWGNFPFIPLPPREHFWFLWALFLGFVIIKGVYALGALIKVQELSWSLVTLVTLLFLILWQATGLYSPWLQPAFIYLPYIMVGMSLRMLFFTNPLWTLAASFICFFASFFTPLGSIATLHNFGIGAGISVAVVSITIILSNYNSCALLVIIGRASMAIYVSHTIVSAFIRTVLFATHVNDVFIHIFLGTSLGILVPLIAFKSIKNKRIMEIIGW